MVLISRCCPIRLQHQHQQQQSLQHLPQPVSKSPSSAMVGTLSVCRWRKNYCQTVLAGVGILLVLFLALPALSRNMGTQTTTDLKHILNTRLQSAFSAFTNITVTSSEMMDESLETKGTQSQTVEDSLDTTGTQSQTVEDSLDTTGTQSLTVEESPDTTGTQSTTVEESPDTKGTQSQSVEESFKTTVKQLERMEENLETIGTKSQSKELSLGTTGTQSQTLKESLGTTGIQSQTVVKSIQTHVEHIQANNEPSTTSCPASNMKKVAWFRRLKRLSDYPGQEMFEGCEYSCCTLKQTSVGNNINDLDLVLFSSVNITQYPPSRPSPNQIWVFFSTTPTSYIHQSFWKKKSWMNIFNWTMTYRKDSDLVVYSMSTEETDVGDEKDYKKIMALKDKKVVSVHGICGGPSKRVEYEKSLKTYIDLDVVGQCPDEVNLGCYNYCDVLFERYKFGLAHERVFCKDFMSTQFCYLLQNDIVPVVRGLGNYEDFAPRNSFINANDFSSVEELGNYLQYLDKNDTAYVEYLKNKEGYKFNLFSMKTRKSLYCEMCKKLHNLDSNSRTYPDLFSWLKDDQCFDAMGFQRL